MASYYLTNKALQDLSEIWEYTFDNWSETQANNYYGLILDSCKKVANNPNFGKNYDIVQQNILGFKSNHHLIFFRVISSEKIEIIRILHERMDLKSNI